MVVYTENHTKHTHAPCGLEVEMLDVKSDGTQK